ncbi:hypothetical protein [Epibacterium sp. Ofav1-8]|uniref:hypothetical protein n=1 Tax=Epibacterium sp. Ofav1-8 TaxID=2917735 RepID=UPI001EF6BE02|nr:hypothetical protein [Epibacterium sp. Ofav1-8]MCG7622448.1 hypothetical protein [Epibacterium sp. Ofav1-8]
MSDTDSFIDEVTEEVRRDRLFLLFKRYGWIGAVVVILIVGGAAWREYSQAQARSQAQDVGDAMTAALSADAAAARADGLAQIEAGSAGAQAVVDMAEAAARVDAGSPQEAVVLLDGIATNGDLPQVYRDIAAFKSVLLQADTMSAQDRRLRLEALAAPGGTLQYLAAEQLALLDIEAGDTTAALARLQEISASVGVSRDLQERVSQVIVALGGSPEADAQDGDG